MVLGRNVLHAHHDDLCLPNVVMSALMVEGCTEALRLLKLKLCR